MKQKICNLCKKIFTRQWNLERHIEDIHHISEYDENGKQQHESTLYSKPSTLSNQNFRNSERNATETDYYANPSEYNNFTNRYSNKDLYNNRFYENFEPVPIDKKEDTLTIRDKLRIQHGLQNLRTFLQPNFPNDTVILQIYSLYYLCYRKNSIQPLRDFFQKNKLMHLWPLY